MYIIFIALILLKIKNITTNIPNGIIRFFEKTINNSMFNLKNIKMKVLKFLSFAVLAMCFAACGGDGVYEVTVDNTTIGGELSKYFSLVDKTYKYNCKEDYYDDVTVELKCIKPLPENLTAYIDVVVLDEDGIVISTSDYWENNFDDILQQASPGDIVTVTITNNDSKELSDPAKIRLSSTVKEIEEPTNSSADEEAKTATGNFELSNVLLPSQLKGKVEVIHAEMSVGSLDYPSMEITFKLLSTINTSSMCSQYGQMWIVGVGQTENGVDVKEFLPSYREWRSDDSDGREFKEFLESEPGETITLEFTGANKSSNVESDLEKVKKFKLKITN